MAEETVAELKKELEAKTAENAELAAKCEALTKQGKELQEKLEKLGEAGVDGLTDKLGKLASGSDDAEEEKPPAEAAADVANKALSFFQ